MRIRSLACLAIAVLLPRLAAAQADCGPPPSAGGDRWPVGTLESVDLDGAVLCPLVNRLAGWKDADIHAVLVARHGRLVFEHYFSGSDERFGRPIGEVVFGRETRHDERSVTKSVTALMVGIAIEHGWIKSVDEPVLSFFPEYADLRSPEKERITLRHLLTMSSGLEWHESDIPYFDDANSENRMDDAPDPYRFALEQPVAATPGRVYNYNSGSSEVLGAVLRKATGKPLDELARTLLFEPLGITDVEWRSYAQGNASAAAGLRLRPRDLAKLGQLVLQKGAWHGTQLVPAAWVAAATSPQINGEGLFFYGYQFWLGRSFVAGREIDWAAAVGLGGQRVYIVPALDLVLVVNAGLYKSPLQGSVPLAILDRYVLAATVAR